MPVIDASVYVAVFRKNESGHILSSTWFRQAERSGETISAPAIFASEVAAALSRGTGESELAHEVVRQLLRRGLVQLWPVTVALAERAAAIAADHRIRGCDAVYVALAEQLGDKLVTLDSQQLGRGAAVVTTRQPSL